MRILVCGGRDFNDRDQLEFWLDKIHKEHSFSLLIHGDARGADRLADAWAQSRGVVVERYPADWSRLGNAAGPIRNRHMLAQGKPDLVVAFAGGRGTAHMAKIARDAGVRVVEVPRR